MTGSRVYTYVTGYRCTRAETACTHDGNGLGNPLTLTASVVMAGYQLLVGYSEMIFHFFVF